MNRRRQLVSLSAFMVITSLSLTACMSQPVTETSVSPSPLSSINPSTSTVSKSSDAFNTPAPSKAPFKPGVALNTSKYKGDDDKGIIYDVTNKFLNAWVEKDKKKIGEMLDETTGFTVKNFWENYIYPGTEYRFTDAEISFDGDERSKATVRLTYDFQTGSSNNTLFVKKNKDGVWKIYLVD